MSEFKIRIPKSEENERNLSDIEKRIYACYTNVRNIRNQINLDRHTMQIRSQLMGIEGALIQSSTKVTNMRTSLLTIVSQYMATEKSISGMPESISKGDSGITSFTPIEMPINIPSRWDDVISYIQRYENIPLLNQLVLVIGNVTNCVAEWKQTISDIKDKVINNTSFDVKAEVGGNLYENSVHSEHGSAGVTLGAYNAYAGADGHLFKKDEDGNLIFDPSVKAEMGASFTALSATAAYNIGNEYVNAHAKGDVTVGKVSGKASAQASLRDKDGNINPTVKAEASAEAILVDASASAGVTVLGTDVTAKASVNVGVGAHATVGYNQGVISCDIGASLGIGASISFEVDISGTVNAIQDVAESAIDGAKKWFKKFIK